MVRQCSLSDSGAVLIHNQHGAHIDSLHIQSRDASAPALHCRYSKNVRLRRLLVEHHPNGVGILFEHCHNISIKEVVVVARRKASGDSERAHPSKCSLTPGPRILFRECDNIHGLGSEGALIERVRVQGGASGIELHSCPKARLRSISALNMRGPYPRGQCVQFSLSDKSSLSDFYCKNDENSSWPEDSISVWRSAEAIVRNGLVDGNNAPNGIGVMFENDKAGAIGGLIQDVDAVRMGGGCFSGYPATNLRMLRVRCGFNHCGGWGGRSKPNSGGQMWAAGSSKDGMKSSGITVESSQYWKPCNKEKRPTWSPEGSSGFEKANIEEASFKPRKPPAASMRMCWERDSE